MKIPEHIFKSYDIRGLVESEIVTEVAWRIGYELQQLYKPRRIVVGHDMRPTSSLLEKALIEGLCTNNANIEVTVVGLCSTPMFYFAVSEAAGKYDLGIMITASHNPAQYNGFKMVLGNCQPIGYGSGMEELRDACLEEIDITSATKIEKILVSDDGIGERYLERVFKDASLPKILPDWKIAIDAGNGMAGMMLPKLVTYLQPIHVLPLYWALDGNFPNHEANPLKIETLQKLVETVRDEHCQLGVAFDGDGDRVGLVDETGQPIPGDVLTALLAEEMLKEHPGATILYDLRSSWSTRETIERMGGKAIMCRVGHAHIKKQMRDVGAVFAGELSMHFYFQDFSYTEASEFAMILLMRRFMRELRPVSEVWRDYAPYFHSGEINFHVRNIEATMKKIRETYQTLASDISDLDGVRLEFCDKIEPSHDWWFNVRASNTEPVIRLNLEAKNKDMMETRLMEVSRLIEAC